MMRRDLYARLVWLLWYRMGSEEFCLSGKAFEKLKSNVAGVLDALDVCTDFTVDGFH